MFRKTIIFITLLLSLVACNAEEPVLLVMQTSEGKASVTIAVPTETRVLPTKTASATQALTPSTTPTKPLPSTTTTPKPTSTPTAREEPTATFDTGMAVTYTPAPAALCPDIDPNLNPDFTELLAEPYPHIEQPILDYLNTGGSKQSVIAALTTPWMTNPEEFYIERDITGDGVTELIVGFIGFYVFGCSDGEYTTIFSRDPEANLQPPRILAVKDLNLNGISEVAIYYGDACGSNSCGGLIVFEWNGEIFTGLFENDPDYDYVEFVYMDAAFTTEFTDIDKNGTTEIILHGKLPIFSIYHDGLPWRVKHDTYMWNGASFVLHHREFDDPEFRFQAVQDADLYASYGEFDRALTLYQDAIFSDELEWWSPDRQRYYQLQLQASYDSFPTPTPSSANPDEYHYLASYARFKIMVLFLIHGWLPEAEIVYDTLQEIYPEGRPGHEFAQMANEFWREFQISNDINKACSQAIGYARENQEILTYLGSDYHGWQSFIYTPDMICQFK
jgi:hypothetical protein